MEMTQHVLESSEICLVKKKKKKSYGNYLQYTTDKGHVSEVHKSLLKFNK